MIRTCLLQCRFLNSVRFMTTTEVSTALRPFYFSVHPDLFGQFPNQRSINENSLKQLSSFIESVQSKKLVQPCSLDFYVRDTERKQNQFRLIRIYLNTKDVRATVLTILKCCDLSTEYVDNIPQLPQTILSPKVTNGVYTKTTTANTDFYKMEHDSVFTSSFVKQKVKDVQNVFTLKNWLNKNYKTAIHLSDSNKPLQEEVSKLRSIITEKLGLLEIRWECGWNKQHFKGCLQSLKDMMEQHPDNMYILKDRILVFASFTGVSLDGYIMLNSGEVRHNWLDLIKNVKKYDEAFYRIPAFEKALSQVLLNIQIVRRKFMPKILAGEYEQNLQQLTTNISDYLSRRSYPKEWPKSLKEYEIVVETEAGPLMVSPTGQFIAPASCPGLLLVKFMSENLVNASKKILSYQRNKHIERSLYKQCIEDLGLFCLEKDDNITPDLMIECCDRLVKHKNDLCALKGLQIYVTNYYSILSDGTVCIPWNWNL